MKRLLFSLTFTLLSGAMLAQTHWKAGTSRINITPEEPVWMGGYASRTHPADGTLSPIWIKALAIQDPRGERAVLVTSDLVGFPKDISDRVRTRLQKNYGLSKAQIILNASHTHSGPLLASNHTWIYPINPGQKEKVDQYIKKLEDNIDLLVKQALQSMEPAELHAQNGVTRFQVNRRNNVEAKLTEQSELKGPNDHAVPVIKVTDLKGKIKTILFGYACHPTVLGTYQWTADYPGFAQSEIEKLYPGVNAMFFQGAGGDQNPLPRRTEGLAKQYGKQLAAAVERVLEEPMEKLSPSLTSAYEEIDLRFAPPMSIEELTKLSQQHGSYVKLWAEDMIKKVQNKEKLATSYPYPVQSWKIGELPLISLGGEVTVEYAIKIKKLFGQKTFVMSYSNDVMAYIPSETILLEGGYEGQTSQMIGDMPGPWALDTEKTIMEAIKKSAKQTGIGPP